MRSCVDPFTYGKKVRRSPSCQSNVVEHTKVDTGWNHSRRLKKKLGVTWTIVDAARPSHSFCAQRAWRSRPLVLPLRTARRRGFQPGQGPPAHVGVYATRLVPRSTGPSSAYRSIFHRWPRHRDVIDVLLNLFSLCRCPRVPGFLAILTCTQRNDERSYQLLVKIRWYVHIPSPRSSLVASLSLSLLS